MERTGCTSAFSSLVSSEGDPVCVPHDMNQNEVSREYWDRHLRSATLSWTKPLPSLCTPHSLAVSGEQIQNKSDEWGPQSLVPVSSLLYRKAVCKGRMSFVGDLCVVLVRWGESHVECQFCLLTRHPGNKNWFLAGINENQVHEVPGTLLAWAGDLAKNT